MKCIYSNQNNLLKSSFTKQINSTYLFDFVYNIQSWKFDCKIEKKGFWWNMLYEFFEIYAIKWRLLIFLVAYFLYSTSIINQFIVFYVIFWLVKLMNL